MVYLGYGPHGKITVLDLSAQHEYLPEQLYQTLIYERPKPSWIIVENKPILLNTESQKKLACAIASAYHNGLRDPEIT